MFIRREGSHPTPLEGLKCLLPQSLRRDCPLPGRSISRLHLLGEEFLVMSHSPILQKSFTPRLRKKSLDLESYTHFSKFLANLPHLPMATHNSLQSLV